MKVVYPVLLVREIEMPFQWVLLGFVNQGGSGIETSVGDYEH